MAVLFVLTLLLVFTSASLAHRALDAESDGLWVVGTGVLTHVFILVPVHALGFAQHLDAWMLAGLATTLCGGALVAVFLREGKGLFQHNTAAMGRRLQRLWTGLLRFVRRAGLPLSVGVVAAGGLWVWWVVATTIAPPRGNSASLALHEPIVGFMLQHRDLLAVELPANLQRINGVPRFGHMTQLWFAAFTGRTFVEWPNVFSHVLAVAATYCLLRQTQAQKSTAVAIAFCFSTIPGVARLTDSSMVDVQGAALTVAAAALVLVPRMRPATVAIAGCSVATVVGVGYEHAVLAACLFGVLVVRSLIDETPLAGKERVLRALAAVLPLLGAVGVVFGRNWMLFDNPVYPYGWQVDALGIDWPSALSSKEALFASKDLPWTGVVDKWTQPPFRAKPWLNPDARVEDYGFGVVFIVVPMAAAAMGALLLQTVQRRRQLRRARPANVTVGVLALLLLVGLWVLPPLVRGRLHLMLVPLATVLAVWPLHRASRREIGRQVAFALQLTALISIVFAARHDWLPRPTTVWTQLQTPAVERDFTRRNLLSVRKELGQRRVTDMTAGKRVGFNDGSLIGAFWNDDYSNEVVWLGKKNLLQRADEQKVDWLFVQKGKLSKKDPRFSKWKWLGRYLGGSRTVDGWMFRRQKPVDWMPPPKQKPKVVPKPKRPPPSDAPTTRVKPEAPAPAPGAAAPKETSP